MQDITVWYNRQALIVYAAVAESLKLKNGHRCRTEREFWEILSANTSHGIAICEHQLRGEVKNN